MANELNDYSGLTFNQLIETISSARFFNLPKMVAEAFRKIPSGGGVESVTGDYVNNTDPLNPVLEDPRPYRVYSALITQSGTDAPVATVLENTLGEEVIWTRIGQGDYEATVDSADSTNTLIFVGAAHSSSFDGYFIRTVMAVNEFVLITLDGARTPSDNFLENTPIEIRVYN